MQTMGVEAVAFVTSLATSLKIMNVRLVLPTATPALIQLPVQLVMPKTIMQTMGVEAVGSVTQARMSTLTTEPAASVAPMVNSLKIINVGIVFPIVSPVPIQQSAKSVTRTTTSSSATFNVPFVLLRIVWNASH